MLEHDERCEELLSSAGRIIGYCHCAERALTASRQREALHRKHTIAWGRQVVDLTLERDALRTENTRLTLAASERAKHYGDWCDVCDAPQMVLPDGEHHCQDHVEAWLYQQWQQALKAASESAQTMQVEIERLKEDYERACCLVAKMHEAAMGKICGPRRGVIEDIADLKAQVTALREAIRAAFKAGYWDAPMWEFRLKRADFEKLEAALVALPQGDT